MEEVRSRYLPREYRNYDMNLCYKVALNNYHGSKPYQMVGMIEEMIINTENIKLKIKEIIIEENHCLIGIDKSIIQLDILAVI
jgi:hypothetical protein